jgi:hypothetical protein
MKMDDACPNSSHVWQFLHIGWWMGALIIGCRCDKDFILVAGGEMAIAATARRDVMVVCLGNVLGMQCLNNLDFMSPRCQNCWLFEESVRSSVDKISFYLSQDVWKRGKITINIISLISVQGSSWQSKAEIQADKNRLLQTCLSILEIFWYLRYPGDWPRDAESLGRSLYLWGAVCDHRPWEHADSDLGLSLYIVWSA